MEGNEGFVVKLDRPRRFRLTVDSVAKVEEERGVDFRVVCKPASGQDSWSWLADMLWVFGLADDPELTPLEAQTIVREYIANAPPFLQVKRMRDMRSAVLRAGEAFAKNVIGEFGPGGEGR